MKFIQVSDFITMATLRIIVTRLVLVVIVEHTLSPNSDRSSFIPEGFRRYSCQQPQFETHSPSAEQNQNSHDLETVNSKQGNLVNETSFTNDACLVGTADLEANHSPTEMDANNIEGFSETRTNLTPRPSVDKAVEKNLKDPALTEVYKKPTNGAEDGMSALRMISSLRYINHDKCQENLVLLLALQLENDVDELEDYSHFKHPNPKVQGHRNIEWSLYSATTDKMENSVEELLVDIRESPAKSSKSYKIGKKTESTSFQLASYFQCPGLFHVHFYHSTETHYNTFSAISTWKPLASGIKNVSEDKSFLRMLKDFLVGDHNSLCMDYHLKSHISISSDYSEPEPVRIDELTLQFPSCSKITGHDMVKLKLNKSEITTNSNTGDFHDQRDNVNVNIGLSPFFLTVLYDYHLYTIITLMGFLFAFFPGLKEAEKRKSVDYSDYIRILTHWFFFKWNWNPHQLTSLSLKPTITWTGSGHEEKMQTKFKKTAEQNLWPRFTKDTVHDILNDIIYPSRWNFPFYHNTLPSPENASSEESTPIISQESTHINSEKPPSKCGRKEENSCSIFTSKKLCSDCKDHIHAFQKRCIESEGKQQQQQGRGKNHIPLKHLAGEKQSLQYDRQMHRQYKERVSPMQRETIIVSPVLRFLPDPTRDPSIDLAHVGYRLATLSALPASMPISRIRLADAGFFFQGQGDEVTCYSCRRSHSGWNRGDNPLDVHRRMCPECPHIARMDRELQALTNVQNVEENRMRTAHLNMQNSAQLPPAKVVTSLGNGTAEDGDGSHSHRSLQSASSYTSTSGPSQPTSLPSPSTSLPSPPTSLPSQPTSVPSQPTSVPSQPTSRPAQPTTRNTESESQRATAIPSAANGTYATNNNPSVTTGITVTAAESRNSATNAATASPNVTNHVPNIPRPSAPTVAVSPSASNTTTSKAEAGTEQPRLFPRSGLELGGAVYPMYQDMQSRRRTFANWNESRAPPLDQIILSGMFYAGYADCTRCFYCGVGLKHWVVTDDVMTEHVRWRPECGYLRAIKGDDFIRETQRRLTMQEPENTRNTTPRNEATLASTTTATTSTTMTISSPAMSSVNTPLSAARSLAAAATTTSSAFAAVTGATATSTLRSSPATTTTTTANQLSPSSTAGTSSSSSGASTSAVSSAGEDSVHLARLQEENRALARRLQCRVCNEAPINTILMPCGHLVTCEACARTATSCPLCHDTIRATARVHMA